MDSGSIKECGICNEDFDEDERCPRNLPCSHCFCTACIAQLIDKDDKKCPFCRRYFEATSAKDMAINNSFLDLLKYVRNLEGNVGDRGPVKSRAKMIEEMKMESEEENNRNAQSCHKAKQQIKQAIQNNHVLKQNIIKNQLKFKGDILIKIKELEARYETNVRYIDHVNESLEKQLEVVDEYQETLDDVKRKLDRVTTLQKVDAVIDEVEEASARLQPWLQKFHDVISRQDKIYQDLRKNIKTAEEKLSALAEVLNSCEEDISLENQFKDLILIKDTRGQVRNFKTAKERLNVAAEVLNSSEEDIYVENQFKDLILTKDTQGHVRERSGGRRSGRGGFNKVWFGRGSRGDFNKDSGGRGGFNNDSGGRGGFNNDSGGRDGRRGHRGPGRPKRRQGFGGSGEPGGPVGLRGPGMGGPGGLGSPSKKPDYSAQWADYYRNMGMYREAEAIEQQAKCLKVGGPGGPTPNVTRQQSEGAQSASPGDGVGGERQVKDYSAVDRILPCTRYAY